MDIAVISIIVLRLTIPLLIVRLPFTGLLCAAAIDIIDFSFLGSYSWYQPVDKLLDLYYLSFCLYVALTAWRDPIARHLAVGLLAYRTIGVGVLLAGAPEWTLILFPNLFEMLFGFYVLHQLFTGRTMLFEKTRDITIILAALVLPKLIQEYSLHVAPFVPLDDAFVLQGIGGVLLWLAAPLLTLGWYVHRVHRRTRPTLPIPLATVQPRLYHQ